MVFVYIKYIKYIVVICFEDLLFNCEIFEYEQEKQSLVKIVEFLYFIYFIHICI